jgi:hypothetical protein
LNDESKKNHAKADCDKTWMLNIDDGSGPVVSGGWTTCIAELRSAIDQDPEQSVVLDTKGVFREISSRISIVMRNQAEVRGCCLE